MRLIKATIHDLDTIYKILKDGQQQLAAQGIDQWQAGYPSVRQIVKDIEAGYTVLYQDDAYNNVGTAALTPAPDQIYDNMTGQWLVDTVDYVSIHRVAIHSKYAGQGHGSAFLRTLITEIRENRPNIRSIRMDTHKDNQPMQHVFHKLTFKKVGEMHGAYSDTGLSFVYEKLLRTPIYMY
ncbi:GNAT family N-acetyltransferase [Agrilactobacillus yilanensis]|uniref:GNAT family N-acetyltransferase n=1 Tax=Agrilactobacillus yilanensis TaxID=2485997 RepID=A0ABW4J8M1_9LACO|nr:GNAT family N-acetyltransferase [Agrilactobacillus yilanensis]